MDKLVQFAERVSDKRFSRPTSDLNWPTEPLVANTLRKLNELVHFTLRYSAGAAFHGQTDCDLLGAEVSAPVSIDRIATPVEAILAKNSYIRNGYLSACTRCDERGVDSSRRDRSSTLY